MAKKSKFKKATKNLFNKFFGFENGVDITNEVAVLHRRNIVIKNIILLSNMFYSLVLFIVALNSAKPADWLFPAIFVPFTFFLNSVIKRLIFSGRHDMTKQQIAMYGMAIYSFVSVILFYARFFENAYLETATYILIYYSVIVISLYQSKPLILWSSFGFFGVMTIVHFTWTYKLVDEFKNMKIGEFLKEFIKHPSFGDLLLRSSVFILFVVVVYAIVSIGNYMQEQRKNELIKRQEIQDDYTNIVSDLLNVVLTSKGSFLDFQHINLVNKISHQLGVFYGLNNEQLEQLEDYALIHLKINEVEDLVKATKVDELEFDSLKSKTKLATMVAKRLQLSQKAEDIARAHIDSAVSHEFIVEMQQIQPQDIPQIILLAELYITMRAPRHYKRTYPNNIVVGLFEKEFTNYFNPKLIDRFLRFQNEFNKIFEEDY